LLARRERCRDDRDTRRRDEETVNEDPYGQGWLVKVKLSDPSQADSLMSAGEYEGTLGS
jgi:glycine cleavage system H protein